MTDTARVERIRSSAADVASRADQLLARVPNRRFKEVIALARRQINDIEDLFLRVVEHPAMSPETTSFMLDAAERVLKGYDEEVRMLEEIAGDLGDDAKFV